MSKHAKISDSEWKVMRVLWRTYPMKSSEIIQELKSTNWSPNTIHTLLSRLANKEIIGVKKTSRYKEYFPLVSQEECQLKETKSFLKKVYDGSIKMMLSSYINEDDLSEADIEYLKELLDEKVNGKERD